MVTLLLHGNHDYVYCDAYFRRLYKAISLLRRTITNNLEYRSLEVSRVSNIIGIQDKVNNT